MKWPGNDSPAWPLFESISVMACATVCLWLYATEFDETEVQTLITMVVPVIAAAYSRVLISRKRKGEK